MDRRAKIAVIGGGVAGCSVAYHLTRLGCPEVVVLESDDLASGSTWHAAGLCTQYSASWNVMKLLRTSVQLYDGELESDTGADVGYHRCGSLRLAATPERVDELHARQAMAHALGIPFEIVGPDRIAELWPLACFDDVLAAAWLPTDGWVDPARLTHAYATGAGQRGGDVLRRARVRSLQRAGGSWTIETTAGTVVADVVVNAAGMWARQVGQLAGVDHPISPLLHQYLTTAPMPEVQALGRELPVLRDPAASYYVRQDQGSLLVGPFERRPRSWSLDGVSDDFHGRLLDPDLEQIQDVLAAVAERVPAFAEAGVRTVVHGPDGYTPDGRCLMGPVPGVTGYHVLAGFSIFGIVFSAGAGKYLAEWILSGQPSDSMWELDVRRFGEYASGIPYTEARAKESYEREYAVHYPHEELEAGRPLKTDPLYDRLGARGAVWGARFGWERPLWFAVGHDGAGPSVDRDERTFRRAQWHSAVGNECRAIAAGVGVLDQTSFGKYLVSGPGAAVFLDQLSANRLPPTNERIVLTQFCNPRGGIECDLTVTRLAADHFYVVSAAATETHDLAWIIDHAPPSGVDIANVTAELGVLTIAGPRSRALLQRIAACDCSDRGIPFFSAVETRIGTSPARVMRLSYVGEMGYELHVPAEYLRYVYDLLDDAGSDLALIDFGYRALESMRIEKCYRLWGSDLTSDYTPFEAGLARFVKLRGRSFIGSDALAAQAETGVRRRLCCLDVDATDADAHGYEPVSRDNTVIGYVTSGAFGHRVQRSLALAYLPVEAAEPGTTLDVAILGSSRLATVVAEPVYDPAGERLLGK